MCPAALYCWCLGFLPPHGHIPAGRRALAAALAAQPGGPSIGCGWLRQQCCPRGLAGEGGGSQRCTFTPDGALWLSPAGEEVCQSYFPLPWSMRERQERCREDYAFCCTCPRCQVGAAALGPMCLAAPGGQCRSRCGNHKPLGCVGVPLAVLVRWPAGHIGGRCTPVVPPALRVAGC